MFEDFKENFLNMVSSRVFVLILVMITIATLIIQRLFDLQIVNGEYYLDSFQTKIKKERTIQGVGVVFMTETAICSLTMNWHILLPLKMCMKAVL